MTDTFLSVEVEGDPTGQERETRYRRLLSSVTDYVYSVTVDEGLPADTSHGPGCEAVTGYTSEEFAGDPLLWHHMIHFEDRPAVSAQIELIMAGETPAPLEHRIVHKSGAHRWIKNTPVPHKDESGMVVAYDGVVSDITERKLAELAMRQSQERLALILQGSDEGIWVWEIATNKVYYSVRWKSMLGYADHELANHFSTWEELLHPDDRERALAALSRYLSGQNGLYELEHRLRHRDGSYRWILARGVVLRDASSSPIRMAGSHVDLTARKQAEEQLRRAYTDLAQNEAALKTALQSLATANQELQSTQMYLIQAAKLESIGTLAAGVAHEVKNPLQTIVMGLDYLSHHLSAGDDNTKLVLSHMRDAVTRADTIVRELLRLSSATEFKPKPEDLNALVERSLGLINGDVIASNITVVCNLGAHLPLVRLDHGKMEQVFINLFINALHAMSRHDVLTISTRHNRFGLEPLLGGISFPQFKPDDQVVVAEVRDSGSGIPEAFLPRIFDPFFTTKSTGIGTGLGLPVVKKILDLHGAAIDIRNDPLGGVMVTLALKAESGERR